MSRLVVMLGACAMLLPPIVDGAHADEPKTLTEAEFLARFERADPRFAVLEARVDASRADVTEAGLRPNPSISYDREEVFESGESFPENLVRLAWPIDLSGRRSRRVRAAETGVRAAEADASREAFSITLDALAVFHDAAYARHRVATLREGRDDLGKLVEIVRARKSAGDVSGYDLERLELELGAYDDLIAEADAELAVAERELASLVGEPDARYGAADPLDLGGVPGTVDELLAGALGRRGDLRAATLRVEQAEDELLAARRLWVPDLVVTGGVKTSAIGDDTALGYTAGVAIELPIFSRGEGAKERSAAKKREWTAAARAIEREIAGAVRRAHEGLARRIEQAKRYEGSQIAKLPDLVRRAEAIYREGDRPISELLDAYRTARDVRLRHLELRHEAKGAEIALWRALGHR